MTRRPDVYRTEFPTRATANPRSIGFAIFCDINTDGGTSTPDVYVDTLLCSIQIDSMDDYQRVFVSATVAGINPHAPTQAQAGASLVISIPEVSQAIIPGVEVMEHMSAATITGAIDLPQGSYTFDLWIANTNFESGSYIEWGAASMQVIVGQVVTAQECWYESNCA